VKVLGLVFAGTATDRRPQMVTFVEDVLGLERAHVEGAEADLFELPDGSLFAVSTSLGTGTRERTIGFLVDDLDAAIAELRAAGIEPESGIAQNERMRYVHVRDPDGKVYELIDEQPG
jgi:glyoxylase I family protein